MISELIFWLLHRLETIFVAALISALAAICLMTGAKAEQSFEWSNSDWGGIGLIQTRNARFGADGQLDFGTSYVLPYQRYFVNLRAVPWLEGTFRYTLSDDPRFSQKFFDSTLTDRGADLKFPIFSEQKYFPAVALGFQDLLGTGLFDGEYLVASKRYYDLDVSLGLAWGYPGNRGLFSNPLLKLSESFKNRRELFSGTGGIPEVGRFFTGQRTSLFAGLEYLTPFDGLRLKFELDGNDYTDEPSRGGDIGAESPFNLGVEYRPWSWATMSLMYERGTQLAGRLAITTQLQESIGVTKFNDPPPPVIVPRENRDQAGPGAEFAGADAYADHQATTNVLFDIFERHELEIDEVALGEGELSVWLSKSDAAPDFELWSVAGEMALRTVPMALEKVTVGEKETPDSQARRISLELRPSDDLAEHAPAEDGARQAVAADITKRSDSNLTAAITKALNDEKVDVVAIDARRLKYSVYIASSPYRHTARAIGRAAVAVANVIPPEIEHIEIVLMNSGVATSSTTVNRKDLENALTFRGSPEEIWHNAVIEAPDGVSATAITASGHYPRLSWGVMPKFRQHIGRPGQFHRFQLWVKLFGEAEIVRGVHVDGAIGRNVYHNFDDLVSIPASGIQHVRSEIVNYLNEGENNLVHLTVNYIASPFKHWYSRITAGYLEEMFAGFGGEVMYRPFTSRWAAGLEVHQVYQREFRQRFGLQADPFPEYDTVTGHFSIYYQSPYHNLNTSISIGRYLAQDIGSTFLISRMFESGIQMGGWATLTDLSAGEFGEGSFDKGMFITIPLDLFFPSSTRQAGTFAFRPLTRDGGQIVNVNRRLYGITGQGDLGQTSRDWEKMFD